MLHSWIKLTRSQAFGILPLLFSRTIVVFSLNFQSKYAKWLQNKFILEACCVSFPSIINLIFHFHLVNQQKIKILNLNFSFYPWTFFQLRMINTNCKTVEDIPQIVYLYILESNANYICLVGWVYKNKKCGRGKLFQYSARPRLLVLNESSFDIEIRYIDGERDIKINFWFMYRFTNSWPHLSLTDSAVGKPKITTMQIFTAAWSGRRNLCCLTVCHL